MKFFWKYPRWTTHRVVKQSMESGLYGGWNDCFVCERCEQTWLSAEAIEKRCPGLPVYKSLFMDSKRPAYLVTGQELKVLGFKRPKVPLAYERRNLYRGGVKYRPLYDQRTARKQ